MTDIGDKAFSGGHEKDGRVPGVQRAGLIRGQARPWTHDLRSSTGLCCSLVATFKFE